MNQNEINRVAGSGSSWVDLSLRLVIARLAGTTHPHLSGVHLALHHRDTRCVQWLGQALQLTEKQRPCHFPALPPPWVLLGFPGTLPAFLG